MTFAPQFVRYEAYDAEYQAAVTEFRLERPDGFTFQEHAPSGGGRADEQVLYEVGAGQVNVYLTWISAVEDAIVNAHRDGDAEASRRWLDVASQFPETDVFKKFNDPDVPVSWFDHLIAPAYNGDFRSLAALVDARRAWPNQAEKGNQYDAIRS